MLIIGAEAVPAGQFLDDILLGTCSLQFKNRAEGEPLITLQKIGF